MEFNLDRDICFFDVEATGLNVVRDRIVQIAIIKYKKKGGDPEEFTTLINPGIPISEEALAVHGITPKMLSNQPTFAQISDKIFEFIGNADLGGYNSNRFDIPILMEEFARVGIEFNISRRRLVDVQKIFYKMEPRTLRAALKFYTGKELTDAHDALADVKATIDVLKGQLQRYENENLVDGDGNVTEKPVQNNMQALHDFTKDDRNIDATQRLRYDKDKVIVFNFGKYMGKPVAETLHKDRQYYNWILNKEFSSQVKQIVKNLVKDYERRLKEES